MYAWTWPCIRPIHRSCSRVNFHTSANAHPYVQSAPTSIPINDRMHYTIVCFKEGTSYRLCVSRKLCPVIERHTTTHCHPHPRHRHVGCRLRACPNNARKTFQANLRRGNKTVLIAVIRAAAKRPAPPEPDIIVIDVGHCERFDRRPQHDNNCAATIYCSPLITV